MTEIVLHSMAYRHLWSAQYATLTSILDHTVCHVDRYYGP